MEPEHKEPEWEQGETYEEYLDRVGKWQKQESSQPQMVQISDKKLTSILAVLNDAEPVMRNEETHRMYQDRRREWYDAIKTIETLLYGKIDENGMTSEPEWQDGESYEEYAACLEAWRKRYVEKISAKKIFHIAVGVDRHFIKHVTTVISYFVQYTNTVKNTDTKLFEFITKKAENSKKHVPSLKFMLDESLFHLVYHVIDTYFNALEKIADIDIESELIKHMFIKLIGEFEEKTDAYKETGYARQMPMTTEGCAYIKEFIEKPDFFNICIKYINYKRQKAL